VNRSFAQSAVLGIGMLVMATLLGGCLGGASTSVVVGSDGTAREVSTLTTAFTPKETLRRGTNVLARLELKREKPAGYKEPGGFFSSEPTEWPIVYDAFSGDARARTANGEGVDLYASWQGQGKTTLKITSTLPAVQHERLVNEITAELNRGTGK